MPRAARWQAGDARRGGVADEHRRHRQVKLVGEPLGEELREHAAAALDHQPPHSPGRQVGEHRGQADVILRATRRVTRLAAHADDLDPGHAPDPAGDPVLLPVRNVDQPGSPASGEEPRRRVEVAADRERDPGRARRQPSRNAMVSTERRPHQQRRIVAADRAGADQDRVAARPHLVDPVEVRLVGQDQPVAGGVVDAAVDGHRDRQQHVRALRHAGLRLALSARPYRP